MVQLSLVPKQESKVVQLFEGEKQWRCRVAPVGDWELFKTHSVKVDATFTASHFLSSYLLRQKRDGEAGDFLVLVKDLATQETFEVVLKQTPEEGDFGTRVRREPVSCTLVDGQSN